MKVRRVVTGHDSGGRSVFVSDEEVEPVTAQLMPGLEFHQLWGGEEPPHFPDDGARPVAPTFFPPVGGFRFSIFSLPPEGTAELPSDLDMASAVAELQARLPGLTNYMERDEPGMHTTDTVDFELVLEGEVILELDDGATVRLGPGDTVVQNGTRHRWSNPGSVPARMVVFMCGARHDRVEQPD